jgi:integrase
MSIPRSGPATHSSESVARACEAALPDDTYGFSDDPDGRSSWRPWLVTQAFERLAGRAGIPEVRLHDLRHFVATRLLSNGVSTCGPWPAVWATRTRT